MYQSPMLCANCQASSAASSGECGAETWTAPDRNYCHSRRVRVTACRTESLGHNGVSQNVMRTGKTWGASTIHAQNVKMTDDQAISMPVCRPDGVREDSPQATTLCRVQRGGRGAAGAGDVVSHLDRVLVRVHEVLDGPQACLCRQLGRRLPRQSHVHPSVDQRLA